MADNFEKIAILIGLIVLIILTIGIYNNKETKTPCQQNGFERETYNPNIEPGYINCSKGVYKDHIKVGEESQILKR